MGIKERIREDMQKAAKERDSLALSALRMAVAAIQNREIDAVTRKEIAQGGELSDDTLLKVIAGLVKQRRESIDLYLKGNRPELAGKEQSEVVVLERYLPKALSPQEIEALAREAIAETEAKGPGDMGRLMKVVLSKAAGRADGKAVNDTIRRLLAG